MYSLTCMSTAQPNRNNSSNMFSVSASALLAALTLIFLSLYFIKTKTKTSINNLPPGTFGWPFIGETLDFFGAGREGKPESFVRERMNKYDSRVFKTSLFGQPLAVFCGASGNKFLYGNENKVVAQWRLTSVQRLFGSCLLTAVGDEAKRMRKMLHSFLNPDALVRYIMIMDEVTQHHIRTQWTGKEEVKVYPTIKLYTFALACRLFMNIEDQEQISKLAALFNVFLKGLIKIPLNFPGTRFYRAMRAARAIKKELQVMARQKRVILEHKTNVSNSQDLFSHLLVTADENGKFMSEEEIINNVLTLLVAGHDTSSSVITMLMKYLGELPQVYENVFREQLDIASLKEPGEMLQWEDIQKMRYSWNVVSEVMRMSPPIMGGFREAMVDFTYAAYTIPKGWKLYWSAASTHKDPNLFPSTEQFDASRFEGDGPIPFSYVPFGGGPRMCLGKEFARLQILVFLHNMVKRFKWDLLIPDEKIEYDPIATPVKGLPIRLHPH